MNDTPKGPMPKDPMKIDVGLVRELAELLDATQLTEIEVEDGGRKIRVVVSADDCALRVLLQ